jgi:hypothetical protein
MDLHCDVVLFAEPAIIDQNGRICLLIIVEVSNSQRRSERQRHIRPRPSALKSVVCPQAWRKHGKGCDQG